MKKFSVVDYGEGITNIEATDFYIDEGVLIFTVEDGKVAAFNSWSRVLDVTDEEIK